MSARIRILIADDHIMVRQGLSQILDAEPDMKVVGQATTGEESRELAEVTRPDVIVMDINMPELDGVQATRLITTSNPYIGVIILTMYRQDKYVFEAIKAGAKAYLLKDADSDELLRAIRAVAAGEALMAPAFALRMMDEFRRIQSEPVGADGVSILTERELDILRLVAQGLENTEIGSELGLSEKTVRNRMTVIFEKLHVNNRTRAALYALRKGFANLEDDDFI